ncbi:MAG: AAA family ATPase [Candidatus Kariarchaeaceae archaeon]
MASLNLIKLQLKNIKSYQDETINFIKKNNVIIGQNGSGKSTILEALVFGLFHKRPSQAIKTNTDLLRNGANKGSITVRFEIGGKNYETETIINESGVTTKKLKYLDTGHVVEKVNDVVADLEHITGGIDADVFRNVVYSEQGQIAELADLTPKKREELINKLMGLEKYEQASKHVYQVLKRLNGRIESKESQIESLKLGIDEIPYEERVGKLETLEDYSNEREKLKKLHDILETELLKLNNQHEELIKLKTEIEQAQNRETELEKEYNHHNSATISFLEKVQFDEKMIATLKDPSLDIIREIEEITSIKTNETEKRIKDLEKRRRKIDLLEQEKSELETKKATNNLSLKQENQKIKDLSINIKAIHPFKEELPDNEELLRLLNTHLETVKYRFKNTEEALSLLKEKKTKIDEKNGLILAKKQTIAENNQEIQQKEKYLVELVGSSYEEELTEENISTLKEKSLKLNSQEEELGNEIIKKKANEGKNKLDIKRLRESVEKLQTGLKESSSECPTCRRDLPEEQAEKIIHETEEQIQVYMNDLQKTKTEVEKLSEEQKQLQISETKLQQSISNLEKAMIYLTELRKVKEEKKTNIKKLETITEELKSLSGDEIKQMMEDKEELLSSAKKSQDNLVGAINSDVPSLKRANSEVKRLSEELNSIMINLNDLNTQYSRSEKTEIEKTLSSSRLLRDTLRECKQSLKSLSSVNEKQASNNELMKQKNEDYTILSKDYSEEERTKKNKEKIELNELIGYLKRAEVVVKRIIENGQMIESYKNAINVAENVKNVLDRVPTSLLAANASRISYLATNMFERLMPSSEINQIILSSDYNIKVIRRGMEDPLHKLSGGESTISALCLRMAIAEVIGNLDLMLLDEPTANLDEDRVVELLDVLQYHRPISQLILVTHNREFDRVADQVIEVTPNRSGSTVKHIGAEEINDL